MDVGGMDLTEQLVATLRNFMRDTAKKLAVLILDSNRKGIVQIAFIVLDGDLFQIGDQLRVCLTLGCIHG